MDANGTDDARDEGAPEASFGSYLKLRREKLGLTRQEVAAELRLTGTTVQWIEEANLTRLPAEVYVKGFLREYAKLVGGDPEEVLAFYSQDPGRKVPVDETRQGSARRKRFFFLALLVLVILAVFFLAHAMAGRPGAEIPQRVARPEALEAPAPEPEEIRVRIEAEDDVVIGVMADGGAPSSQGLSQGESLHLSARSGLNLLLADPGAVRVFRNGRPLVLHARPGQPANIRIP